MTEDKQFETMGLQATNAPTNPLHRMPPYLKRKHVDNLEEEDLMIPASVVVSSVQTETNNNPAVVSSSSLQDEPSQGPPQVAITSPTSPDGSKRLCVDINNDDNKENHSFKTATPLVNAKKSAPPPLVSPPTSPSSAATPAVFASKSSTSSASSTGSSSASSSEGDENDDSGIKDINEDDYLAGEDGEDEDEDDEKEESALAVAKGDQPKVIVEHQPLPSIYDLQHMTAASSCVDAVDSSANDHFDSGLSEDESGSDDAEDSDTEVDSMAASPLFDPVLRGTKTPVITPPTPKVIYNDRFWNQGSFGAQNMPPPPSGRPCATATPPPPPQPTANGNSFQFLESGNRIECAENGESYLQLGTINHSPPHHSPHHHLPVTPVIQPKPNMVYRRPIPPFRSPSPVLAGAGGASAAGAANMVQLQQARPVCDHSNCLQRKSSFCYKNQRSRMLNLSLHKLHLARQNHEGCLRRSVLICNMLRYIEDESEKEAMHESQQFGAAAAAAAAAALPPAAVTGPPPPPPVGVAPQPQQQQVVVNASSPSMDTDQYWPPSPSSSSSAVTTSSDATSSYSMSTAAAAAVSAPMASSYMSTTTVGSGGGMLVSSAASGSLPASGVTSNNGLDTYDTALKDFNSAFRSTPYSSPIHPGGGGSEATNVGDVNNLTADGLNLSLTSSTTASDERGSINWGSVLSLGSQSELDPLNNNSFNTDGWPISNTSPAAVAVTGSTIASVAASATAVSSADTLPPSSGTTLTTLPSLSDLDISGHTFDDIGWKLSADDVLKAFPNDEQIFVRT